MKEQTGQKEIIFGTRAVIEAIIAGREIEKIWIQNGTANDLIRELKSLIRAHNIPSLTVPAQKIDKLANHRNHQGVVCFLAAVNFASLDNLIDSAYSRGKDPFIVMLDHITDVRNFGAIARTAECLGVDGIVIPEKGNAPVMGDAMKTSAGALNHLPVCRDPDLKKIVRYLRDSGLTIIACTEKASKLIWEVDMNKPLALIIGSEDTGISDALIREADELVKIPISGKIASLNASVAAGMAIYEATRQRGL